MVDGRYQEIYGNRHDMMPMLKSASAPGRPYVLLATDELVTSTYNFNNSPLHIIGIRTKNEKLVTYTQWQPFGAIEPKSHEREFYDYATEGGRAETDNKPDDPRALQLLDQLRFNVVPDELRKPLPGLLGILQQQARARYLSFAYLIDNPPAGGSSPEILKNLLGFGFNA